jgi:hypothetical protein
LLDAVYPAKLRRDISLQIVFAAVERALQHPFVCKTNRLFQQDLKSTGDPSDDIQQTFSNLEGIIAKIPGTIFFHTNLPRTRYGSTRVEFNEQNEVEEWTIQISRDILSLIHQTQTDPKNYAKALFFLFYVILHELAHLQIRLIGWRGIKWPDFPQKRATPPKFSAVTKVGQDEKRPEAGAYFQEQVFLGMVFPHINEEREFSNLIAYVPAWGKRFIIPAAWCQKLIFAQQPSDEDYQMSPLWDQLPPNYPIVSDLSIIQGLREPGCDVEDVTYTLPAISDTEAMNTNFCLTGEDYRQ